MTTTLQDTVRQLIDQHPIYRIAEELADAVEEARKSSVEIDNKWRLTIRNLRLICTRHSP